MAQVARNLSGFDGELAGVHFLIHDRNAKYTAELDGILGSGGIEPVKLPVRSPNLNASAERFVRSIKEECLGIGKIRLHASSVAPALDGGNGGGSRCSC